MPPSASPARSRRPRSCRDKRWARLVRTTSSSSISGRLNRRSTPPGLSATTSSPTTRESATALRLKTRLVAGADRPRSDVESYGTDSFHPLLVIEVADSSPRYDLSLKSELYARAGIPEYWVVDLPNRVLVVFRDPREGAYETRTTHQPGSRIAPVSWPDFEIDVDSLFPAEAASSQ